MDLKPVADAIEKAAKRFDAMAAGRGDAAKPKRTFTPEQIENSRKSVERAKKAYEEAPLGMQRATRKKELEEAEAWLKKVTS